MRVSRLLLAVCAVGVCTGFISIRADDTPAQAVARAALEREMSGTGAQQAQTNTPPAVPPTETTSPPAAAISTPPAASNIEAQKAAQAALEQKMREQNEQEQPRTNDILVESNAVVVVVPPQPAPEKAAPAMAPSVLTPPPGGSGLFAPVAPVPPDVEAQNAAQVALEQKMAELNQEQFTAQPAASQTRSTLFVPLPGTSGASYAAKEPGFQPIVAPPLPISPDKEAQLRALNARYLSDQITPEEYFKQRAQILAAP
jgi:hypothetical protein